jgi:hypothetical protein
MAIGEQLEYAKNAKKSGEAYLGAKFKVANYLTQRSLHNIEKSATGRTQAQPQS